MDSFNKNEDIYRSATLQISSVAADTANFTAIEVDVYHSRTLAKIGEYTLAAGTVTKASPTSGGGITFIVAASETADAETGVYYWEARTTETDADYEDSTRLRKFAGECFKLEPSNE